MRRVLAGLLVALLWVGGARAEQTSIVPPAGVPASGGTYTGLVTFSGGTSATTLTLTGTAANTVTATNTIDYSTGGYSSDTHYVALYNILALSATTSNIFQQDTSFLALRPAATWGAGGVVVATVSGGAVTALTLTPGSGYPSGTYPVAFAPTNGGSAAAATVTVAGGVFSSYSISAGGTGYTGAPLAQVYAVQAAGEVRDYHGYTEVDAGAWLNEGGMYEASYYNYGVTNQYDGYTGTFGNGPSGIVLGQLAALNVTLGNFNTTPGAISTFSALNMNAENGGGSVPLNYYVVRNAEPNASISTLGGIRIGSLGTIPAGEFVQYGPDTGNTIAFEVCNVTPTCYFTIQDNGVVSVAGGANLVVTGSLSANNGVLNVGSGTAWSKIYLNNSTGGGSQQLSPVISGTLSGTITAPNGTYTLAGLSLAQTFSGADVFSSTLNFTGVTADSGQSDASLCEVTSGGKVYYGSGTGGLCLTTSTARFKDHIRDAREGLREIMRLHTVDFNYLAGYGYDPAHRYEGWTAEEMSKAIPRLVGHDAEGRPNSVDMMGVLPIAVGAIQDMQWEIRFLALGLIVSLLWCAGLTVVVARRRLS